MKRLPAWAAVIALVALGGQSMASPPVTPPAGSIGFVTETFIESDGPVRQSENFYWEYYEQGEGNFLAVTQGTDACGHPIIITPGFQEAAAIFYKQNFTAINGSTTFYRSFAHDPNQAPNLHVRTDIGFQGDPFTGSARAAYDEEVGLTVISAGADDTLGNRGSGLLSLCPWAAQGGGSSGGGYPATSAGIAAGSSFKVTNIVGFTSEATVISTDAPFFKYSVDTLSGGGKGIISAWFAVDIMEGTTKWGSHDIAIHQNPVKPTGIYAIDDPPAVLSRTSYSENASADGVWTFRKTMSYQSTISKTNPIFLVP